MDSRKVCLLEHQEKEGITDMFCMFPAHGKIVCNGPQKRQEVSFPINQDPANILGRADVHSENFRVLDF